MRNYRLYMRAFAPWKAFGGIIPGPSRMSLGSGALYNDSNFDGDSRGFSVDTGPAVTSRINFYVELNLAEGKVGESRVWSNQSRGPYLLLGPQSEGTARPKSTMVSYWDESGTLQLDVSISGPNPLVPGSPDIDARCEFSIRRRADGELGPRIEVATRVSGDQFPAFETFISDRQDSVFLGGFAPESRSPGQLARLFGQLNRPSEIYFASAVTILLDERGALREVFGSFGNQSPSSRVIGLPAYRFSLTEWNRMLMKQVPMPIDGWLW